MARDKNRHQVMVGISIDENGVPRIRPLSAKEQRRFHKTHPNVILPTFSAAEIQRGLEALEEQLGTTHPKSPSLQSRMVDPSTISVVNDPSAR
jgi:hypothetical protein